MEPMVCVTNNKGSGAYLKIESIANMTRAEPFPAYFRNSFPVCVLQEAIVVIDMPSGVVLKNKTGIDDLNVDEHLDVIHEIPYLCLLSIINTGKSGREGHEAIEDIIFMGTI